MFFSIVGNVGLPVLLVQAEYLLVLGPCDFKLFLSEHLKDLPGQKATVARGGQLSDS